MSVLSGPPTGGAVPPARGTDVVDRVPVRASGLELIGEMAGSGYRRPPALVRRRDGQTVQLTPLLYQVLEAVDGDRDYDEIAARAGAAAGRPVSGADARTLVRAEAAPARAGLPAGRFRAGGAQGQSIAGTAVPLGGLRPGAHPADHRSVRPAVQPAAGARGGGGLRAGGQVGAVRPGPRLRRAPSLRRARPAARGVRDHPCIGRVSRVRARRRGPVRRCHAGRDGRRAVPDLARLLHRRHRQLPARAGRPVAHRPGWPVFQRPARGRCVRVVVADRLGRAAADRRRPADPDDSPVAAADPVRRLSRVGRPDRGAGPVPPDQADAGRPAAHPLAGLAGARAQAVGSAGGDPVGAGGGSVDGAHRAGHGDQPAPDRGVGGVQPQPPVVADDRPVRSRRPAGRAGQAARGDRGRAAGVRYRLHAQPVGASARPVGAARHRRQTGSAGRRRGGGRPGDRSGCSSPGGRGATTARSRPPTGARCPTCCRPRSSTSTRPGWPRAGRARR